MYVYLHGNVMKLKYNGPVRLILFFSTTETCWLIVLNSFINSTAVRCISVVNLAYLSKTFLHSKLAKSREKQIIYKILSFTLQRSDQHKLSIIIRQHPLYNHRSWYRRIPIIPIEILFIHRQTLIGTFLRFIISVAVEKKEVAAATIHVIVDDDDGEEVGARASKNI